MLWPCGAGLESGVQQAAELAGLPGWWALPAVRTGRVFVVDHSLFSRPGPRCACCAASGVTKICLAVYGTAKELEAVLARERRRRSHSASKPMGAAASRCHAMPPQPWAAGIAFHGQNQSCCEPCNSMSCASIAAIWPQAGGRRGGAGEDAAPGAGQPPCAGGCSAKAGAQRRAAVPPIRTPEPIYRIHLKRSVWDVAALIGMDGGLLGSAAGCLRARRQSGGCGGCEICSNLCGIKHQVVQVHSFERAQTLSASVLAFPTGFACVVITVSVLHAALYTPSGGLSQPKSRAVVTLELIRAICCTAALQLLA